MERHTFNKNLESEKYYLSLDQRKGVWPIEGRKTMKLGRAARLLMEITHPRVATAINQHTSFTYDRLERTVRGNVEIIFGTRESAVNRAQIVNRAHQLKTNLINGESYTANDPKLKGFVFDMRILAAITAHENFVGFLTSQEKDKYVIGVKPYGSILGVPDRDSSNSWSEVVDRFQSRLGSGVIDIGSDAKEVAQKLIEPIDSIEVPLSHLMGPGKMTDLLGRLTSKLISIESANKLHSIVTRGLLPAEIREAYCLDWNDKDKTAFEAFTYSTRVANSLLPNSLTFIPEFDVNGLN